MHIDDQILQFLATTQAVFVSELVARTGLSASEVDIAVERLAAGPLVLVHHRFPDPHLTGDFRILAAASSGDRQAAFRAAERYWQLFVQTLRRTHRCA